MRDKIDAARPLRTAHELEPPHLGLRAGLRIALRAVRPPALARDDVGEPVPVHVGEVERVQFGEAGAVRALRGLVVHQTVLDEADHSVLLHLLEPREAEVVRREARDHVAIVVAVDIEREHLRSTFAIGEGERVVRPLGIARERLRLLEPTALPQDVQAPVAVDVADAEPVREAAELQVG